MKAEIKAAVGFESIIDVPIDRGVVCVGMQGKTASRLVMTNNHKFTGVSENTRAILIVTGAPDISEVYYLL